MSYLTQARLAADQVIMLRATACAVSEGVQDPSFWVQQRSWQLSIQPGCDAAYASALAGGDPDPGGNESVITDGMILAAVQAIRTAESSESPAE